MDIRWMIRRDMPEVLAIEKACYEFPWSESDFVNALQQRNIIGMVAVNNDDQVIGFAVYAIHKTKIDLLNVAVHPCFKRKKAGTELVAAIKAKHRRKVFEAVTREANFVAQMWLKSAGFRCVVQLRDYYKDCDEPGYLFRFDRTANSKEASRHILKNRVSEVSK